MKWGATIGFFPYFQDMMRVFGFLADVGALKNLLFEEVCFHFFSALGHTASARPLRGAFPHALIRCLKASIKPTYTENITKGERQTRALLLFDKATAKLGRATATLSHSLSFPADIVPLHSTASSTRLFTYSPVLHSSTSLLLKASPSFILYITHSASLLFVSPCS